MLHPMPLQRHEGHAVVQLKGLSCGYDKQEVLSDVTLDIMEGDFVGLLGPSGSGKTTLLRTILGAVDIYQGQVEVDGVSTSQQRPRVGYVPQLETIDWNFPVTVQEVVMMGRTMDKPFFPWFGRKDRMLATEMMERLGISLDSRHIYEDYGHTIVVDTDGIGSAMGVYRDPETGVLSGAADSRAEDGGVAAY